MKSETPPVDSVSSIQWTPILAKLEAAKPHLVRAGSVVARHRPNRSTVWVVRYPVWESGVRHVRSIYLGDVALAGQARSLISQWREEAVPPLDRIKAQVLQLANKVGQLAGLSGRARKRLSCVLKPAMEDPIVLLAMSMGVFPVNNPLIRNGKRRGRRRKSGLW